MIKKFESFKEEPKVDIKYYDNGNKKSEKWYLNSKDHREDGPAIQWWYENGQKGIEDWYLNGIRHREDGPAVQDWNENGQIKRESWYLKDIKYTRESWIDKLKKTGSKHYKEQRMLFDMEKYNL